MPHIAYVERTTYFEVFADFSGSPRHAALTDQQWADEYANNPAYESLRTTYPGSIGGIRPKGIGKWSKDWENPYKDPFVQLVANSAAPPDYDGVPAVLADGVAKHVLTIKKVNQDGQDVTTGSEPIRVIGNYPVPISNSNPNLVNGQVTVEVGPLTYVGNLTILVSDPSNVMRQGFLPIRFK